MKSDGTDRPYDAYLVPLTKIILTRHYKLTIVLFETVNESAHLVIP